MSQAGPSTGVPTEAQNLEGPLETGRDEAPDIPARENSNTMKMSDPLNENNWTIWRERMKLALRICGLEGYIYGTTKRPENLVQAKAWDYNDTRAQFIIINNVTYSQMVHIGQCTNAMNMWANLEAVHETKSHQTAIAVIRNLFRTTADEDTNINKHLTILKGYWECIHLMRNDQFKLPDSYFKVIISSSLPKSWDVFTESYVSGRQGEVVTDTKKLVSLQEFIGILKEEYVNRQSREVKSESTNQVFARPGSLAKRIGAPQYKAKKKLNTAKKMYCRQCTRRNHNMADCLYLGQDKCDECGRFGHLAKHCWNKKEGKKRANGDVNKEKPNKRKKQEQTHATIEEEDDELITFGVEEKGIVFDPSKEGQYSGFDEYDPEDPSGIDLCLLWYDWLADSATTSHITNQRGAYKEYTPINGTTVTGVGSVSTAVEGRGTVELDTECDGRKYTLRLENVLYIPKNKNSLISLGQWETDGRRYLGKDGKLILIDTYGTPVAVGVKIKNNLYKMRVRLHTEMKDVPKMSHAFNAASTELQRWEVWHRRYGHIGYGGLQKLLNDNLVDGLNVDKKTPKPDCVACTEAKMTREPFKARTIRVTAPGQMTHMDLWGKYEITSIGGYQYYIVFVDDASRYITVNYLKKKDEASTKVKEYLAHLSTQDKHPKAVRMDRGKEFINESLKLWCRERGIEMELTAPYSPSQNGVAERMNRTLVELARAMSRSLDVPEFLWEYAISHAAYVRNRAYTRALEGKTPYEVWFKKKPEVSHLREYGAPVWILLQGQKEPCKMLSKSKRQIFVGFEDGPKAVKYYSAESRKILTSRNFRFLTPQKGTPPEEIVVAPDEPREGESRGSAPPPGQIEPRGKEGESLKRKRPEEEEIQDLDTPRKTRGKRVDYRRMNDPFSDGEEEPDDNMLCTLAANAEIQSGGDEPQSLDEAQRSPDWKEWERAVKEELDQLREKGTWILVEKPADAIPVPNKWVFIKKYNKDGDLLRYKARFVAKGCAQRPGQDYTETFSPVVRLETVRAIIAMSVSTGLHMRQMDVKGAYLNGTLKEKVYMRQPTGYEDETGRVCLLVKTIYSLKQSGREWNKELDNKLQKHNFGQLISDPCAYTRKDGHTFETITVWVDDLLLFASTEKSIIKIRDELRSEWSITDLGEPSKIVGIEITCGKDSITISQKKYIENILRKEKMEYANPVAMPMDPNLRLEPNKDGNQRNH